LSSIQATSGIIKKPLKGKDYYQEGEGEGDHVYPEMNI